MKFIDVVPSPDFLARVRLVEPGFFVPERLVKESYDDFFNSESESEKKEEN